MRGRVQRRVLLDGVCPVFLGRICQHLSDEYPQGRAHVGEATCLSLAHKRAHRMPRLTLHADGFTLCCESYHALHRERLPCPGNHLQVGSPVYWKGRRCSQESVSLIGWGVSSRGALIPVTYFWAGWANHDRLGEQPRWSSSSRCRT